MNYIFHLKFHQCTPICFYGSELIFFWRSVFQLYKTIGLRIPIECWTVCKRYFIRSVTRIPEQFITPLVYQLDKMKEQK